MGSRMGLWEHGIWGLSPAGHEQGDNPVLEELHAFPIQLLMELRKPQIHPKCKYLEKLKKRGLCRVLSDAPGMGTWQDAVWGRYPMLHPVSPAAVLQGVR